MNMRKKKPTIPEFAIDFNNRNKKVPHSKKCGWDKEKLKLSISGICMACDVMRTHKTARIDRIPDSAFGLDNKLRSNLYCATSTIPYARCTKKTNPSCACGRLVYYKEELDNFGELY